MACKNNTTPPAFCQGVLENFFSPPSSSAEKEAICYRIGGGFVLTAPKRRAPNHPNRPAGGWRERLNPCPARIAPDSPKLPQNFFRKKSGFRFSPCKISAPKTRSDFSRAGASNWNEFLGRWRGLCSFKMRETSKLPYRKKNGSKWLKTALDAILKIFPKLPQKFFGKIWVF